MTAPDKRERRPHPRTADPITPDNGSIHQQHSGAGTVRFDYLPHTDAYLVTAPIVCDLTPGSPPRPQTWRVEPHIATALVDAYEFAGYTVVGHRPRPGHMHVAELRCALCQEYIAIWAREIFHRAGSRHRDIVFTSLLRVLDVREARQLAAAYDEVAA